MAIGEMREHDQADDRNGSAQLRPLDVRAEHRRRDQHQCAAQEREQHLVAREPDEKCGHQCGRGQQGFEGPRRRGVLQATRKGIDRGRHHVERDEPDDEEREVLIALPFDDVRHRRLQRARDEEDRDDAHHERTERKHDAELVAGCREPARADERPDLMHGRGAPIRARAGPQATA